MQSPRFLYVPVNDRAARLLGLARIVYRAATALALLATMRPAAAAAQSGGGWTAMLTVQPYPSAFLADWQRNPQTAMLSLLYSGASAQDVRIEGYVRSADRGELARVTSGTVSVGSGPWSQIFTAADILDWATVSKNQQYIDLVVRTGVMPEGRLEICADVLNQQNARLAQTCAPFTIALPDPPQLIFPSNGGIVAGLQPVFQWTPVRAPPDMGVTYRLRIVEVFKGQLPPEALASNPTWFEDVVEGAPLLVYPIDALPLEDKKQYAWRVEALDGDLRPLTRGGRSSEIWSFAPGGAGRPPADVAGALPDVIDLVPGVARLKGLKSAVVEDRIATYALNGSVHLEILAPTAFEAIVEATDLEIDKMSLQSGGVPRVSGGMLGGKLALTAVPGPLTGRFAQFDRIDYTPASGITMTGKLTLPGTDPVPLTGKVQLTAAGLFGTLHAEGVKGAPITSYGADPARLLVQTADVQFPAGTVALNGGVELFKKDVGCSGVTAAFDAQGALAAQVSCTPQAPVSLVAAGDRAQIDLLTLTGNFAYDPQVKNLTYALQAAAQLKLDARPGGANCGASLRLDLTHTSVNVGEFAPRCDATEGAADLGWLSTRLSSLTLNKFVYTPAQGFDFSLSVDLMPWLPEIPGFQLPALLAVTVTQAGLTIPAVDIAITREPIIIAGFGVKVKRVRLPGFTLAWKDWQISSATGFKFAFDADLSLPKITGEAACLTAQPISIVNAEISSGHLRIPIVERTFTPACGLTLNKDAPMALASIPLTETAGDGAQQAGSGGGSGGGVFSVYKQLQTFLNQAIYKAMPNGKCTPEQENQAFLDAAAANPTTPFTSTTSCPPTDVTVEYPSGGNNPWKNVEQKPDDPWTNPPLVQAEETSVANDPNKRWPADPAARKALEDKEAAELLLAEDGLRKYYYDPNCDAACKKTLLEKREAVEREIFKKMTERYFGANNALVANCLSEARKKALAVDAAGTPPAVTASDDCGMAELLQNGQNILKAMLVPPPSNASPEAKDRFCKFTGKFASGAYLGMESQRQIMGIDSDEGPSALTTVQSVAETCGTFQAEQLAKSCDPGTQSQATYDVSQVLGNSRQQQLLGGGETSPGLSAAMDCVAKLQKPGVTQVGLGRPPPRQSWDVAASDVSSFGVDRGDSMASGPFATERWSIAAAENIEPGKGKPISPATGSAAAGAAGAAGAAAAAAAAASFEVRLELERFGGTLALGFYPQFIVESIPEIEGNIILPSIFQCAAASNQKSPLTTKLRLGPRGEINGAVIGFIPSCPFDLASVKVSVTHSQLSFSTAKGTESLTLQGTVNASFTVATSPVTGTGSIAIDLLRGRFIDGSIYFKGPFDLGFPREKPVLAFRLQSAGLDTLGLHIDGRGELILGPGQTIGTTFDQLTINPLTAAITKGRVLFDASFGLEVGIGTDGGLAWGARPLGAPILVSTGLRIDLPSQIALASTGFSVSGDGGARLLYDGKDVDGLTTKFSSDFTLSLSPAGVSKGMVDFQRQGVSMAYIDQQGFHPNLAYFASAVLPAKLPLPSVDVAYLELRDAAGNLRVTTENTGQGIRIFTAPNQSVPLIVPALQVGRPSAPRLNVQLDLTLDPLGEGISLGSISATVPPGDLNAFDLSPNGLPFAIHTLAYDRAAGSAYKWTLAGALKLFNRTQGGSAATDLVTLTLDGTGRLTGAVNLTTSQVIPIVEGSQKVMLTLQSVTGAFDANLPAQNLRFNLAVTAGIDFALSATESYHAGATLSVSDLGVRAENITVASTGADDFKYLDLSAVKLGLRNLRIPELSYTTATGFKFRMLFDAGLRFPALKNLTLPPIADIELTNSGFSIPAYDAPELQLATASAAGSNATMTSDGPLDLGGFALNVMAFRMSKIEFNWFTGQGPTNWGFGFDLELGLGNLITEAPQALKDMRVQVLNAGFNNGRLSGTVERLQFPTPLNIGIGKLHAISGSLPDPSSTAANVPFSLTAEFELQLEALLPVCAGKTQITKQNSTLSIYGDGWVSGTINGIAPTCAIAAGPFTFAFNQSSVVFGYGNANGVRTKSLEMAVGGTVTFPGVTTGSTVTASGNVRFDLLNQKWIDGRIDVLQPFKYSPSDNNPYFAFDVDRASLDKEGLHFTAGGSLRALDGAKIGVTFNDLTFTLPDFSLTKGSVTFTNQFALGVGITNGQLQWGVYSPSAPRPPGSSFRFIAPQSVTLDKTGLSVAGTATAELAFSDKSYTSLSVAFVDGFKVGFKPVAINAGRANFMLGPDEIAHVDVNGFWPGNVFGVLPVPAKLMLPSADVAYVELRNAAGDLLIETQTGSTGLQLRTRPNQAVKLVVPGLATAGGVAPAVNVFFDIVVNPANFQLVSGFVRAEATATAPSLLSLEGLGIPLTVRKIGYEKIAGNYGLRLAGRFKLPASLNGLDVDVPDLQITAAGLSGHVKLGSYINDGVERPSLASKSFMNDTLSITINGADLVFGSNPSFALSGIIFSQLFRKPNESNTVLFWSGGVTSSEFTFELNDTKNVTKLPILLAEFEPKAVGTEPALRVTASAEEFKVRMSGVLTIPNTSPDFAITIAGLQLGTKGIVFPTVSVQGFDPSQELRLFGAKFRLKDSLEAGTIKFPALKVGAEAGHLAVTLSGEMEFMDNTSRFWGLKVATSGNITLAGANLLSKPLVIVQNVLSVDKATIESNTLKTEISVVLPAPLNSAGPQKVFFAINANGSVTGGANIALVNQSPSLTHSGSGPDTHANIGIATIHVRYLGVKLDFADLQKKSSVQVVTDFYIQNEVGNRVKLGDVSGGIVTPGLNIGFDGVMTWGTLGLDHEFLFNFEAVKLKITNVSLPIHPKGFAIGISGKLSLAVAAVTGELNFQDFFVTSEGKVEFSESGITGGEFAIADVMRLQVSNFGYSSTPTTIQIKSGGMPSVPAPGSSMAAADPSSASKTVNVASYISFGGRISVLDVFDGGVERFLFYKGTDGTTHLLIQKAKAKLLDIVDFTADFAFDETPGGFEMVMGADGKLWDYNVILVGAFAKEAQLVRAGIFVAVTGFSIRIGPYVEITGLGGGFFYNPKPEYLEYVRQKAHVSQTAGNYIAAPPSEFAVLLYGEVGLVSKMIVKGQILLTVANTYFRIDGHVVVLDQGDSFEGDIHLQIAFKETDVQGNVAFKIKYGDNGSLVNGQGQLNVFVRDAQTWGITGNSSAKLIAMLDGSAAVMIGPAGFYFVAKMTMGLNIWVIALEGFMDARVWYQTGNGSWGAYVETGVKASVLGGILSATGTLRGALIVTSSPFLFAAASLEVASPFGKWDGWVWAKFQNNNLNAGFGQDPTMMAAIAFAKSIGEDMEEAKDEATAAIDAIKSIVPGAVTLSNQELVAAYQNIQGYPPGVLSFVQAMLAITEFTAQTHLTTAAKQVEDEYRLWYNGVLRRDGMPGDTAKVVGYTTDVATAFNLLQANRPQVEQRIALLGLSIQQLEMPSAASVNFASPIRGATAPVYRSEAGPDGKVRQVLVSAPTFDVDQAAAQAQVVNVTTAQQQAEANDLKVREQIAALEAGLATLRLATTSNDPASLATFAGEYSKVAGYAERQFSTQADLILTRQDWMRTNLAALSAKELGVNQWIDAKTASLVAGNTSPNYGILKDLTRNRIKALVAFSGNQGLLDEYDGKVATLGSLSVTARWDFLKTQANTAGKQLYFQIAWAGMTDSDAKATAGFTALAGQATDRLGTIRTAHASISSALDGLYQVQADATGALYDLYDRYIFWRTAAAPTSTQTAPTPSIMLAGVSLTPKTITAISTSAPSAPTAQDLTSLSLARSHFARLAQDLTVPKLNAVTVTASNATRYSTQLLFNWSAWHPSGTYEFRFRDATGVVGVSAPATGEYVSNGGSGSRTSYRFTPNRSAPSTIVGIFDVGVRGGAGFTGYGRTTYGVGFNAGPSTPATVSGGGIENDNVPPSTPVVRFAGGVERVNASGLSEVWTNDPDAISAEWSAYSESSGIGEYEYALWATASGTTVIRPFTSVGGRTQISLDRLELAARPLYLAVRAKSGQGIASAVGVSSILRYDPTPPVFASGATLTHVVSGIASGGGHQQYLSCPAPPAPLPTASPATSFSLLSSPVVQATWDGNLGPGAPTGAAPFVVFRIPDASDPETDVVAYMYRVTPQRDTTYSGSGWTAMNEGSVFTAWGAPMNHRGQFFMAVAPRNSVGVIGNPLTYGPFRVQDPSPPTRPEMCAGAGNGNILAQFTGQSVDEETGIVGYQYRVRAGVGKTTIRNWPAASTVDWPAGPATTRPTAPLSLVEGQSYLVDVRAVNGQGMFSALAISGMVLYDVSAPPAPTASVTLGQFQADGTQQMSIALTAPTDAHSGLTSVQLSVGTTATASDVVAWREQTVVPGSSQIALAIPAPAMGQMRWVRLRTVNGAGIPSTIYTTSVLAQPVVINATLTAPLR